MLRESYKKPFWWNFNGGVSAQALVLLMQGCWLMFLWEAVRQGWLWIGIAAGVLFSLCVGMQIHLLRSWWWVEITDDKLLLHHYLGWVRRERLDRIASVTITWYSSRLMIGTYFQVRLRDGSRWRSYLLAALPWSAYPRMIARLRDAGIEVETDKMMKWVIRDEERQMLQKTTGKIRRNIKDLLP